MNKTTKEIFLAAAIAFVVAVAVLFYISRPVAQADGGAMGAASQGSQFAGATGTSTAPGNTPTGLSDLFVQNTSALVGPVCFGGSCQANNVAQITTPLSCAAGTSTVFAVQNPYGATSTASVVDFYGTSNATGTTLIIGTSTAPSGYTSTTLTPSFANMTIATNTPFYVSPGIKVGSPGYVSPGANTFQFVVVGPNDYIGGFATSTATGVGAVNYSASFTNCGGGIMWDR